MSHPKRFFCGALALCLILSGGFFSGLGFATQADEPLILTPNRPLHIRPIKIREPQRLRLMPVDSVGAIDLWFYHERSKQARPLAQLHFRAAECGALGNLEIRREVIRSTAQDVVAEYYDNVYRLSDPLDIVMTPRSGMLVVQVNDQVIEIPLMQRARYIQVAATQEYRVSLSGAELFVPRWLAKSR